jgi:hypothetical protein
MFWDLEFKFSVLFKATGLMYFVHGLGTELFSLIKYFHDMFFTLEDLFLKFFDFVINLFTPLRLLIQRLNFLLSLLNFLFIFFTTVIVVVF